MKIRIEVDTARMRPADLPWLVGDPSRMTRQTGWSVTRALRDTLLDVLDDWRGRTG